MRRPGYLLVTLACLLPPTAASVALAVAELPARLGGTVPPERALADAAAAILHADYRGDRAELARLAQGLEAPAARALEIPRLYWRGFALWRRALNGFNETPTPSDLFADLDLAATQFRAALALDPSFEEAESSLAGCLMSQMFLVSAETSPRRTQVYGEGIAVLRALRARGTENPRSLWILGGSIMGAPPPWGGDMAKATALYERGLAAARRESEDSAREPWAPRWGAAEGLMSLAYMHSHGAHPEPAVARAYALGALAAAPDWHYVADILLPAIAALPESGAVPAVAAECKPPER